MNPLDRSPALSLLLGLPRELRDSILENLLVCDTFRFECGTVPIPDSLDEQDGPQMAEERAVQEYPLRLPCARRTIWTMPLGDLRGFRHSESILYDDKEGARRIRHLDDPDGISIGLTYQRIEGSAPVELGIMLVCQQLYHESSEILYGKNTFSFLEDSPYLHKPQVPTLTALAFLKVNI
jgi:hypothetical protein